MIYVGYTDFWHRDLPLAERVAKFAHYGVQEVNVWAWRSKGTQMDELAAACRQYGVVFSDTFDEVAGSLTDATDHPHCLDAWAESIARARQWGIKRLFLFSEQIDLVPPAITLPPSLLHIQGYAKPPLRNYTPMQKYANLIDGIHKVLELVEKTDLTIWFESLGSYHLHGDITCTTHEMAADIVRRINHPQFRFTFDCYHQQRTAGNLIQGLRDYAGLYDAVHIGDVPTRGEPGSGEINFANIAKALHELAFGRDGQGRIGLEYSPPVGDEANSFARTRRLLES